MNLSPLREFAIRACDILLLKQPGQPKPPRRTTQPFVLSIMAARTRFDVEQRQ